MSPTLQDARLLWDFLGQGRCHVPCELLVVCGSYDLRVCDHACELLERGLAERLLFTGNTGHWTRHLWVEPEAELFARHARARGVSDSLIVIEPRATNFAENIAFARELFPDLRRATFVTKPNSIRRVALTLPVRWPGLEGHVDAPDYAFPQLQAMRAWVHQNDPRTTLPSCNPAVSLPPLLLEKAVSANA